MPKEVPYWQRQKERFLPKKVRINIDGTGETWEFEESRFGEKSLWVKYKLKDIRKYSTEI